MSSSEAAESLRDDGVGSCSLLPSFTDIGGTLDLAEPEEGGTLPCRRETDTSMPPTRTPEALARWAVAPSRPTACAGWRAASWVATGQDRPSPLPVSTGPARTLHPQLRGRRRASQSSATAARRAPDEAAEASPGAVAAPCFPRSASTCPRHAVGAPEVSAASTRGGPRSARARRRSASARWGACEPRPRGPTPCCDGPQRPPRTRPDPLAQTQPPKRRRPLARPQPPACRPRGSGSGRCRPRPRRSPPPRQAAAGFSPRSTSGAAPS